MSQDPLNTLFQSQDIPKADASQKQKHFSAALDAFREENEKISPTSQGNAESPRPTPITANQRSSKMSFPLTRTWMGAIAASVIVGVGFVSFAPKMLEQGKIDQAQQPHEVSPLASSKEKKTNTGEPSAAIAEIKPKPASPLMEDAVSEQEADSAQAEEVIVTGVRQSVASARELKRENAGVVDSLSAQELAKSAPLARQKMLIAPQALGDAQRPPSPTEDRDRFEHSDENSIQLAKESPVSTFSIDVDTAAYSYVRRQLNQGRLPAQDAVRIEEMVNYFDYHYPLPKSKDVPFATHVNVMPSPWTKGNQLVQIGIKGFDVESQPNSNLVFLLDVSGSMNSPDKLPLVKQSMGLLLDTLKPTDTVAIVVYAGAAGTVLEPTKVAQKQTILDALNRLQAGGSTAGGQGLELAYKLAESQFDSKAVNRIMLATDGDFNVGITQDERLEDFVQRKREKGIYLSVLGFGQGNYQDALMQKLAQNGNGIAAYIDTLSEAQKVLVHQATSALFPIANDVKIQVEFNPEQVKEYRLIGYETRALKREDFNNDKVDAGDIGAGHTVTAIYEITPVGAVSGKVDPLRYGKETKAKSDPSSEIAYLKLRYKLPGASQSKLIEQPITATTRASEAVINEFQFATAVAGFAQQLKGSAHTGQWDFDRAIALAQAHKGSDEYGYRTEFIQLVRKAKLAQ